MNKFCFNCRHRTVSKIIRHKFNKFVRPAFLNCPINDKNIVGCTVKFTHVDWGSFIKWLKDNQLINEIETTKPYEKEKNV